MLQRAPETSQREILNYLSSFDMLNYMESIVGGVMYLLKLCEIPENLICSGKMLSVIILVIMVKCYKSQQ